MVEEKEFRISDIQQDNEIIIKILDPKLDPIAGEEFKVSIDNAAQQTFETNEEGIIRLTKPQNELKLFFLKS